MKFALIALAYFIASSAFNAVNDAIGDAHASTSVDRAAPGLVP